MEHQAQTRDAIGKSSGGARLLYSSWAAEAVGGDKRLANSNVKILDSNGRMVLQGAAASERDQRRRMMGMARGRRASILQRVRVETRTEGMVKGK